MTKKIPLVIDLEVVARTAPVYAVRKALGLLSPGETLLDQYKDSIDWERERNLDAQQDKRRSELQIHHPKSK